MATAPTKNSQTAAPTNKPRKRAPENETARQRFIRVASLRLQNAIDAIKLLGQIGVSLEYEYKQEEAEKMLKLLADQMQDTATKLRERKKAATTASIFEA